MAKRRSQNELRVVLDTNVYLSAFLTKGTVRECLQRAVSHPGVSIGISSAIKKEIADKLHTKMRWVIPRIAKVMVRLRQETTTVHPRQRVHALTSIDESDNRILEAAIAFHANCIVSGDKHLLNLKEYKNIPILTPRQFLDRLEI